MKKIIITLILITTELHLDLTELRVDREGEEQENEAMLPTKRDEDNL